MFELNAFEPGVMIEQVERPSSARVDFFSSLHSNGYDELLYVYACMCVCVCNVYVYVDP